MNAIDIAFQLHDGINFYWNFYVPACVAILGWVFSRKEPWPLDKRVAVGIAIPAESAIKTAGAVNTT
jgi:hypothetical protein